MLVVVVLAFCVVVLVQCNVVIVVRKWWSL
jgi:hypothetical protein